MALFTALISAGALGAAAVAGPLAGVDDAETTIERAPGGAIAEYHFGKGDVIFVRDRALRWYRVQLNEGCLDRRGQPHSALAVDTGPSERIDRFAQVRFLEVGYSCAIDSIRRSAAPPQVDSRSVVTLD